MRHISAQAILRDAYRLMGRDVDRIDRQDAAEARSALAQALAEVWRAWWWQPLMHREEVLLAPLWEWGSEWMRGEAVCYRGKYYVSLVDDNVQAPLDGDGKLVVSAWAKAMTAAGLRQHPAWQAKAWSAGSLVLSGAAAWQAVRDALPAEKPGESDAWIEVPEWHPVIPYVMPDGSMIRPDGKPTGPAGVDVRAVGPMDPVLFPFAEQNRWEYRGNGIEVLDLDQVPPNRLGGVFVWYRWPTPQITDEEYDATRSYEPPSHDQLITPWVVQRWLDLQEVVRVQLPVGATGGVVGYQLRQKPEAVVLSVAGPVAGDMITAHVVGTPSETQCRYELSGAVPGPGYELVVTLITRSRRNLGGVLANGIADLSSGQTGGTITYAPVDEVRAALVSVITPPNGDLLRAFVVGQPGITSFEYTLSAPVPGDGYKLAWTIMGRG